ncbi:hypothetical protein COP2_039009 [Malus domestica]
MKRAFLEKFFPTSRIILLRKKISGIQQDEGLLPLERQMLDASAGRALVDKTPMAAKILIANRALNAQQYEGVGQRGPPRQQVHEVSSTSNIQTQLANLTSIVSQMAEGMKMQGPMVCGVCSIQGHASKKCPQLIENGDGRALMPLGFKAKISQDMIHTPTRIIRGGETIQTSNGESHNNPNHKEALGNNPRASTPSHTHPHELFHNLPKLLQVMI